VIGVVMFAASAALASASSIDIPLKLNYLVLDAALRASLFTNSGGRARLWPGDDDCQYLDATNPRFGRDGNTIKLEADGNLVAGIAVGDRCIGPLNWSGIIESSLSPYAKDLALKFRVTDLNLYDQQHQKSALVGRGFDLIKGNFIPAIETFSYDLRPALTQLGELAQLGAASPAAGEQLHHALATLRPVGPVVVEDSGLRMTLRMDLPDVATPNTAPPSAPLTPEEAKQWDTALENWDSFLVFAIKQLAVTVPDPAVRQQLLDILIDSRQRLVTALAQPARGPDPVRLLFLDEWTRLGDIVEAAAARSAIGDRAVEFISFISAGDALFALDQAGPALGMRISADDLRRLARMMAPQVAADPLVYNFDEDPELGRLFGVQSPPASGEPLDLPADAVSPIASPSPLSLLPSANPTPSSISTKRTSRWRGFLATIEFAPAAEAQTANTSALPPLQELGRTLHRLVVSAANVDRYRAALSRLLTLIAANETLPAGRGPNAPVFLTLVKTTAWQESCWRQYTVRRQRIWFVESQSGDIGLMQVNKYVWRGFYSLPRLKWDVVYNAWAGAGILGRLLLNAPDRLQRPAADPVALARSVYAAYNGGPGAYLRWTRDGDSADARAADSGFAVKLDVMQQGQSFDILSCAAAWDKSHGD
jgi:hypothetical protein